MKWLITGGCGFIGTALVRRLRDTAAASGVRVVDNFYIGRAEDLFAVAPDYKNIQAAEIVKDPSGIELFEADVCDAAAMERAALGCDVIVHLAAHTGVIPSIADPGHDMRVNMLGTFNVLEAARLNKVPKVLIASSGAALGKAEQPVNEGRVPKPSSPYGAGKAAAEMYASAYFHSFGIATSVLRFSNVYGPGSMRKGSVVAKFVRQAVAGEALTVNGDGGQLRDYIFIDDLMDAIEAAVLKSPGGEIFQIATQVETPVREIARIVQEAALAQTGRKIDIVHVPALKGDEDRVTADISKARALLGFSPKVFLPEGVAATLRYFLALAGKEKSKLRA